MPPKKAEPVPEVPPEPAAPAEPQSGSSSYVKPSHDAKYVGEWQIFDGVRMRHGRGIYTEGAQSYDGEFQKDAMHGFGMLKFASGASYEGSFEMGQFSGKGKYVWADGARYEGQWRNGKMHGSGIYHDGNGKEFRGQFANGVGPGLYQHVH
eukprot:ANDGO_07047.mRNA.1 Phosphatidylinositol 4-phosphate 5-kinase 9